MDTMYINVIDINVDASGNICGLIVTDGNQQMCVTPYQVFDAMLHGRMVSDTVAIYNKGIQILANGTILDIELSLSKVDKQLLKVFLGKTSTPAEPTKTDLLEAERQAFLIKDEERRRKNQELADAARAQGLVNLSPEERRKRRQEYFRNKKNNG